MSVVVTTLNQKNYTKLQNSNRFEVVSGQLLVTDPCYKDLNWCNCILNVKNGIWKIDANIRNTGSWGSRVYSIEAKHENAIRLNYRIHKTEIGVDSGQAGFFDPQFFQNDEIVKGLQKDYKEEICKDEPWYSYCCDRTLAHKVGVIPYGVVSSSGYGDGGYELETATDENGTIIACRITFIEDEEENDDGYDDYNYDDEDYDDEEDDEEDDDYDEDEDDDEEDDEDEDEDEDEDV